MTIAELAPGRLLGRTHTRSCAITLDHLGSIACSSGAKPPVSDTGVIENQRAGRDVRHYSIVGSELVIALRYYTRLRCVPVSAVGAAREGMAGAGDEPQRTPVQSPCRCPLWLAPDAQRWAAEERSSACLVARHWCETESNP
jgi:hypothetical protein